MIKINKKEVVSVEGVNWKVDIELITEGFSDIEELLMEAATRGVEYCFYKDPKNFQIGTYVQTTLQKKNASITRLVNSYHVLINASKPKLAEDIRTFILNKSKIDIQKEKLYLSFD